MNGDDPWRSFACARRAVRTREICCEELVARFLERIGEKNEHLNAFTFVSAGRSLEEARAVDRDLRRGRDVPLAGLVLAVKDVICIKDLEVTCASNVLQGFRSVYDATCVARLRRAGAVIIGTTNCDEFAMGSTNENSCFGPVLNPHDREYVPGGSSGGSAAAVAAGLCHAALGTDTGGSIRQPAAFCGVVGLKPTYGRVSRSGLVAFASSLDCVGTFACTINGAASVLESMAGLDPLDATSAPVGVPRYAKGLARPVEGLKIGLPAECFADGLDGDIRRMLESLVEEFRSAGAEIQPISLAHMNYGIATYYILATAEASSNLARFDGIRYGKRARGTGSDVKRISARSRTEGFGAEVKRRIMLGTYVLSSGYYDAYYAKAQRVRSLIRRDLDVAFEDVDVVLTPVTPSPGIRAGSLIDDPLKMYLSDLYTVPANLAGVPGLVVPVGTHPRGLPVGVQFLARPFDESRLLSVGQRAMELAQQAGGFA